MEGIKQYIDLSQGKTYGIRLWVGSEALFPEKSSKRCVEIECCRQSMNRVVLGNVSTIVWEESMVC